MSVYRLTAIKHGLETTAGTTVAATWKFPGTGNMKIEDKVIIPEYLTGEAGSHTTEDTYVAETETTLTLADTECSAELLAYMLNAAIMTTTASATTRTFSFPGTAANTISAFTWEMATATQEYEMGYGFFTNFSIHGDTMANNGRVMFNGVVKGQKATASTATSGLTFYANHQPLNVNNATIKIDAAGTAAGTASATTGFLRGFSMDVETGWHPGRYLDGRTGLDYGVAEGGGTNYKITGNLKVLLSATAVTEIANTRAGTTRIVQIALNGTSSRAVKLNLPLSFTEVPSIGDKVENGLIMVEFPYEAGYSRTSTAQAPQIVVTLSGALTIT